MVSSVPQHLEVPPVVRELLQSPSPPRHVVEAVLKKVRACMRVPRTICLVHDFACHKT
jgi:hypothetical protein